MEKNHLVRNQYQYKIDIVEWKTCLSISSVSNIFASSFDVDEDVKMLMKMSNCKSTIRIFE